MTDPAPPNFVKQVLRERDAAKFVVGRRTMRPLPHRANPIVISVLKDENIRLPDFLQHYRSAGVERFALIDNGSTDGSFEYLATQPDVDLFRRVGKFHWIPKQGWINRLIADYGYDRWYIYADIDELIVFDGLGSRAFLDITRHAERSGLRRVRGFLIDMYAQGPLLESRYARGGSIIEAYPFFDLEGYEERKFKEIISVKGGPRMRVFGKFAEELKPELTKYPLFMLYPDEAMVNPHHIWPLDHNFQSSRLLGILHFKFLPDLADRIRKAIAAKCYWNDSAEYKSYLKAVEADAKLSMFGARSGRYETTNDLIEAGLIEPIAWAEPISLSYAARASLRRARARLLETAAGLAAAGRAGDVEEAPAAATLSNAEPFLPPGTPQRTSEAAGLDLDASEFVGFLP